MALAEKMGYLNDGNKKVKITVLSDDEKEAKEVEDAAKSGAAKGSEKAEVNSNPRSKDERTVKKLQAENPEVYKDLTPAKVRIIEAIMEYDSSMTYEKGAGMKVSELADMLEDLAGRAMLLDMEQNGQQMFCLPPPMAGFFEFSMMRVRGDVNQKALAELYYQYLNVEEDFVKALFVENGTPLGRIFVQEAALPQDGQLEVLDYERASHILKTASHIGVSMCYCRHKMQHLGRACDAPMDICMTFNTSARSLIKYGHARQVDAAECLDLLAVAQGHNLVQFGENAREGVNFICNCCGCCCEALLAIKRFAIARTIHSNFIARAGNDCRGCGKCEKVCPVNAIHMEDGPAGKRFAFVDPERCIGCGVCVRSCAFGQLTLEARPERAITPLNTVNRVVAMAAERGMIKELLEDNDAMGNHRIMAAVIGAIMKLPGAPRALAVAQLKSRYLENLIGKMG